ncbi:MAG: histidinol-phosphate transaminase [Phycisphaerae bacterium]|nr:histidinol-phosphate transaminase [Phycisphaerae bacterium]
MSYVRHNIERMTPYVPGAQPPPGASVVKLNTNENPYPPSPRVAEALAGFEPAALRAYPDPTAGRLRNVAAEVLGVKPDWILPANGSDDAIMMIARAAGAPDREIAYATPTFTFYDTQARIEAAGPVEVPYGEDYALPVEALAAAGAAVTFVASPNSPSGTLAPTDQLAELAERSSGLLIVDEAYVDFADETALPLIERFENVVVLRTLSKGYSLAGLRVGFAVARPALLEQLAKTKQIYNVGALPAALAAAAMSDQAWKDANVAKVRAGRAELTNGLRQRGWRVWDSQANFLWTRPPEGNAAALHEALSARGILVRHFRGAGLDDKLRITVGTDEQNAVLLAALGDGRSKVEDRRAKS